MVEKDHLPSMTYSFDGGKEKIFSKVRKRRKFHKFSSSKCDIDGTFCPLPRPVPRESVFKAGEFMLVIEGLLVIVKYRYTYYLQCNFGQCDRWRLVL